MPGHRPATPGHRPAPSDRRLPPSLHRLSRCPEHRVPLRPAIGCLRLPSPADARPSAGYARPSSAASVGRVRPSIFSRCPAIGWLRPVICCLRRPFFSRCPAVGCLRRSIFSRCRPSAGYARPSSGSGPPSSADAWPSCRSVAARCRRKLRSPQGVPCWHGLHPRRIMRAMANPPIGSAGLGQRPGLRSRRSREPQRRAEKALRQAHRVPRRGEPWRAHPGDGRSRRQIDPHARRGRRVRGREPGSRRLDPGERARCRLPCLPPGVRAGSRAGAPGRTRSAGTSPRSTSGSTSWWRSRTPTRSPGRRRRASRASTASVPTSGPTRSSTRSPRSSRGRRRARQA